MHIHTPYGYKGYVHLGPDILSFVKRLWNTRVLLGCPLLSSFFLSKLPLVDETFNKSEDRYATVNCSVLATQSQTDFKATVEDVFTYY